MWRIRPIIAPNAKIRQICPSPSGHQRPLNRGYFYPILYPLRTSETLPEHQYEGHFFRRRPKKVKITPPAVLFPNHSYNSILYSVSLSGNRTGRTEAGFFLVSVQEICQPKKTLFPSFPSCNHYRSSISRKCTSPCSWPAGHFSSSVQVPFLS